MNRNSMNRALANPWLVLAIVAGACWSSWRWYAARIAGTPEEGVALALTVALVVAVGVQRWLESGEAREPVAVPLLPLALLLGLYAAAQTFAPPIIVAAIAVTALLSTLYRALLGAAPPLASYGLVALSLPVLPSLQFVLGYPMRIVSAALTTTLLELQGLSVARDGTNLLFAGETVQFDAPCSGVKMLWAGLMLTLSACVVWRSGLWMTLAAVAASLALTLAANVLRAASLFYVEAGIVAGAPAWWHEAIGLASFALAAVATMHVLMRLRSWEAARWAR